VSGKGGLPPFFQGFQMQRNITFRLGFDGPFRRRRWSCIGS
jgi:hypothetical protein